MRAVTEAEFNEWVQHPMTLALRETLRKKRETLKDLWEGGSFTDYTKDSTVLVNVGNLGTCKGYAFAMNFTYEDYVTELDDGESKRVGTEGSGSAD
jgi:hypothetical protein